jgi:hypothetical protein
MVPESHLLSVRLDAFHADLSEVKTALTKLSEAITKLALVELTQAQTADTLERAFRAIENLQERTSKLEQSQVENKRTNIWVDRAVTGFLGILVGLVIKYLGVS